MNKPIKPPLSDLLGLTNKELAFLMVRVGIGTNLFFHGLVRIPKLTGFVQGMESQFAETLLPGFMVTPMAYAIPFVELILGIMLLLGVKTRAALVGAAVQMLVLIVGCCFLESWGPINSQMFLLALSALLVANLHLNRFAITSDTMAAKMATS